MTSSNGQVCGSFRDPKGQVFIHEDRVLRTVTQHGKADYDFVSNSAIYKDLVERKIIIAAEKVNDVPHLETEDVAYILEHPKLSFISHPYEWSFHTLKKAALHHLNLQIELLEHNITLSDASAYNIQFIGPHPVFIDSLSLCKYNEGDYWTAHGQFCEQFLNPLLLRSLLGVAHNAWYRGAQEGIPTHDLAKLIPISKRFSWRIFTQVIMQDILQRSAQKNKQKLAGTIKKRRFPKSSYTGMLYSLKNWIEKLTPKGKDETVWGDYNDEHSYASQEYEDKVDFIKSFVSSVNPDQLWDIGCNDGHYATIALQSGAREVIGFDVDQTALSTGFKRATQENLNFLPLYFDAANQSPDQGWQSKERQGLESRRSADAVINLAFAHHMMISKNIPMRQYISWLIGFSRQGVVEFVPKNDPMVQELLSLKEDIFPDYTQDNFMKILEEYAKIIKTQTVTDSGRILIWYRVKD